MEPKILFNVETLILEAGSTTSISQTRAVSGTVLLVLAWAACAILIITGA